MNQARLMEDYQKMAKPRAIEEVGDIYLIRPLGFLLVQALRRTSLTPTMVSVLAVLAGWLSAWFFFESRRRGLVPSLAILGALALLLHSALDSADGQLARLKDLHTPLGRIVDGFCDNLSFLAIYLAVILGSWESAPAHRLAVVVLGVLAAASHSVQSSLVEYQRTLYLTCVHGRGEVTDLHAERVGQAVGAGAVARVLLALYKTYSRQQRFWLSSTWALEQTIARWRKRNPSLVSQLASRYQASHRPLLPFWSLLASNSHKAGIVAAALVPVCGISFWAGLGSGWYFIYVLLLNATLLVLIPVQARSDRRLAADLEALAAAGEKPQGGG